MWNPSQAYTEVKARWIFIAPIISYIYDSLGLRAELFKKKQPFYIIVFFLLLLLLPVTKYLNDNTAYLFYESLAKL